MSHQSHTIRFLQQFTTTYFMPSWREGVRILLSQHAVKPNTGAIRSLQSDKVIWILNQKYNHVTCLIPLLFGDPTSRNLSFSHLSLSNCSAQSWSPCPEKSQQSCDSPNREKTKYLKPDFHYDYAILWPQIRKERGLKKLKWEKNRKQYY